MPSCMQDVCVTALMLLMAAWDCCTQGSALLQAGCLRDLLLRMGTLYCCA